MVTTWILLLRIITVSTKLVKYSECFPFSIQSKTVLLPHRRQSTVVVGVLVLFAISLLINKIAAVGYTPPCHYVQHHASPHRQTSTLTIWLQKQQYTSIIQPDISNLLLTVI